MSGAKAKLAALTARHAAAKQRAKAAARASLRADDAYTNALEAAALLRRVASAIQQEAHARIAGLASRCLAAVYDDPPELVIDFEEKRGRTEAVARLLRNGNKFDPLDEAEGGAVDIAAFALRLAALGARRPPLRPCLIIDEPFKNTDKAARRRVGALLEKLCEEGGLQIIMTTHWDELRIGKVVEL